MTRAEREWVRTHRSPAAEHWNLLSDLTVDQLDCACVQAASGTLGLLLDRTGFGG